MYTTKGGELQQLFTSRPDCVLLLHTDVDRELEILVDPLYGRRSKRVRHSSCCLR